jgi:eukaryotic-like serine/threonine-protein kinase
VTNTQGPNPSPCLEMAHVLFMDIVAYSRLPMDEQTRLVGKLQQIVRSTTEFARAQKRRQLLRLPTGDGLALVFFGDAEAPVRCAIEISRALRDNSELKLRMGIHTGPVQRVEDINANRNVAGGGINIAQRVMDCGDAGHILVSGTHAEVLGHLSSWRAMLHDLGEAEVKHGARVHLYNLYDEEAGNSELPRKISAQKAEPSEAVTKARKKNPSPIVIAVVAALALALVGGWLLYARKTHALSATDTIVLADFDNKTGDAIFDDTLKTALNVSLRQSPFLSVLSDQQVAETLKLMTRPADTELTPAVTRELCQRAGSKAYIAGSIGSLGSEYVLGLKAVNCQSGDTLAQEQVTAASKEKVLQTLGEAASKMRGELGESLATVQKFDVPLEQATTSSLEALKAYSLGAKAYSQKAVAASPPYFQRAIDLDPNFAMGYDALGENYWTLGELGRAKEYFAKAFALRGNTTEREKRAISGGYYLVVIGDLDKAAQTYQEEIESYPRESRAYSWLGNVFLAQGQYEKATDVTRQFLRLAPNDVSWYENLGTSALALQRFDEARQMARKADDVVTHELLYVLAFVVADSAGMAEQQQWFADKHEYENVGLSLASDTEAYAGHLRKARELTKRSVDSAIRADSKETGAIWLESSALREAAFGNVADSKKAAEDGLKLVPTSPAVEVEGALAYAIAGEAARAEWLAQDLNKRFPLDTQMQSLWLPPIRAQLSLDRKNPNEALNDLRPAAPPIEFGMIAFNVNISCLYPTYIRGQAYLAAGQGKEAAAEFQKILDHGGIVWNCWTGALARLGVARANALQARTSQGADADAARVRALAAYKDFLTLWKDADPDVPILIQAKAEYAKLQ